MIDLVRAEIERRYRCRMGILGTVCNTGEPYVTIGTPAHGRRLPAELPGVVPDGCPAEIWGSEKEACVKFLEAFNKYAAACEALRRPGDDKLVLFWRFASPHLFMQYQGRSKKAWTLDRPRFVTKCRIRCRLILTAKPVVWETQREYDAALAAQEEKSNGDDEEHTGTEA